MKNTVLAAGIAAALTVAAVVPAAAGELPLTLNAGVSHWYFSSDRDLENMTAPMAGLEWAFNDNWAAELSYADDDANDERYGSEVDVSLLSLGMLYYGGSYIGESGRLRPYAALGVVMLERDPKHAFSDSNDDTTVHGGVGVRWMITQRFGARLDARMVYGVDDATKDAVVTAGLNYYLGDVTPAAAPLAAATGAPVDSDGDGVSDDQDQCPGTPAGTRVDAVGCPLPVARVASIKLKVNFAFDSAVVQEQYFNDLRELADFLKRFEDLQVDVEGHSDSTGPADYNQQLSQRRADAVVDMLVNQYGIAARRLEPRGYGESQPVASNDTAAGRAENRRVMATLEVEYEE